MNVIICRVLESNFRDIFCYITREIILAGSLRSPLRSWYAEVYYLRSDCGGNLNLILQSHMNQNHI